MLLTLLGSLLGGLFRLAPEFMKWLDKKDDRAHELSMFDKQLEADKLRSQLAINEVEARGQIVLDAAGLDALKEGIKAQGQMTGVRWIDGLNQSVRPFVTYILLGLYAAAKGSGMVLSYQSGLPLTDVLQAAYTADDMALLGGILNFWFLDRVIRRRQ